MSRWKPLTPHSTHVYPATNEWARKDMTTITLVCIYVEEAGVTIGCEGDLV